MQRELVENTTWADEVTRWPARREAAPWPRAGLKSPEDPRLLCESFRHLPRVHMNLWVWTAVCLSMAVFPPRSIDTIHENWQTEFPKMLSGYENVMSEMLLADWPKRIISAKPCSTNPHPPILNNQAILGSPNCLAWHHCDGRLHRGSAAL